jgi:hypothetical protein
MEKSAVYNVDDVEGYDDSAYLGEKTGTVLDRDAMARLGKDQVFKVRRTIREHLRIDADLRARETLALHLYLVSR